MIISYENKLKTSTISATNENANRDADNLFHNFLELAFYATTNSSVITITFDSICSIDHIAFDYHNINTMTVQLYDGSSVLLDTQVITVETNCNFHTFTKVENVKKAVITVDTLGVLLYIGGISMGEYFEFPRFQQSLKGEIQILDESFISGGGQVSGNKKRNRDPYGLDFANITNDEKDDIKTYLRYVQNSMAHFIDFYEDGHTYFKPFYGCMVSKSISNPKRNISTWKWDISLTYMEVR